MPIYEFYSTDTGKIYSFLARSIKFANLVPLCPDGKAFSMRKVMSSFSVTGNRTDAMLDELPDSPSSLDSNDPFSSLPHAQAEKVMRELERSVGSMDDENPDPRQMGALMRKMCDMTGEKIDGAMEEVVRKLEEGTDPKEIEEKMGEINDESCNDECGDDHNHGKSSAGKKRTYFRDPNLYDLNDYLPVDSKE